MSTTNPMKKIICTYFGCNYIVTAWKNILDYVGDGSKAQTFGQVARTLYCTRCGDIKYNKTQNEEETIK